MKFRIFIFSILLVPYVAFSTLADQVLPLIIKLNESVTALENIDSQNTLSFEKLNEQSSILGIDKTIEDLNTVLKKENISDEAIGQLTIANFIIENSSLFAKKHTLGSNLKAFLSGLFYENNLANFEELGYKSKQVMTDKFMTLLIGKIKVLQQNSSNESELKQKEIDSILSELKILFSHLF